MTIEIIRMGQHIEIPVQATTGSAGWDLSADIENALWIHPGEHRKISTGLKIWLNDTSIAGLIVPRSGKGNEGYGVKNFCGILDSDYQGILFVTVWNTNEEDRLYIKPGDKIAQLVLVKIPEIHGVSEVTEFSGKTIRGENGYGHTGG